jgi:hypothetical protein
MMALALAACRGRHVSGRFQANVLLEAFHLGEDRQREIAGSLATVWAAVAVLLLSGGVVIGAAGLMAM